MVKINHFGKRKKKSKHIKNAHGACVYYYANYLLSETKASLSFQLLICIHNQKVQISESAFTQPRSEPSDRCLQRGDQFSKHPTIAQAEILISAVLQGHCIIAGEHCMKETFLVSPASLGGTLASVNQVFL